MPKDIKKLNYKKTNEYLNVVFDKVRDFARQTGIAVEYKCMFDEYKTESGLETSELLKSCAKIMFDEIWLNNPFVGFKHKDFNEYWSWFQSNYDFREYFEKN